MVKLVKNLSRREELTGERRGHLLGVHDLEMRSTKARKAGQVRPEMNKSHCLDVSVNYRGESVKPGALHDLNSHIS